MRPKDKERFDRIRLSNKKMQFLVGRLMIYRFVGKDFMVEASGKLTLPNAYISLTHSGNLVALAVSETPVGIDAENTFKKRDFTEISQYLSLEKCQSKYDFYPAFTRYEADFKLGHKVKENIYLMWKRYLICLACDQKGSVAVYEFFPQTDG